MRFSAMLLLPGCTNFTASSCAMLKLDQSRIARSVRHHRAAPRRGEDVHVRGAALHLEHGLRARARDRCDERARQLRRSRGPRRLLRGDLLGRYIRVVRSIALKETAAEQLARISLLQAQLLDPITCSTAALRLEALGPDSIEVLKTGLAEANYIYGEGG